MDIELLIYLLLHGFGIGYMLILGLYLLLTKKSLFDTAVKPNFLLRRSAGVNVLMWGGTFVTGMVAYFLGGKYDYDFLGLDALIDLFLIPGIGTFLFCLVQVGKPDMKKVLLSVIVPVVLLLYFVITQSVWAIRISSAYWFVYIVLVVLSFGRKQLQYKKKLKENFSDLHHKELKWINQLIVFFLLYASLYAVGHYFKMPLLLNLSYAICLIAWTYITWHVEHQEKLVDFWEPNERKYSVASNSSHEDFADKSFVDGKEQNSADHAINQELYDKVEALLEKECIANGLYLQNDLSLPVLAAALGTNRTYLSQYFTSKNTTFYSYINGLRIDRAVSMIRNKEKGVTMENIYTQCGFNSSNTFRRAFIDKMGCTPALYVAKMLGKKD
ncbi:MAG: helix-turn-helix transcriptional regulator [Prevotellaceae bacterium]|nr:helix-turn-helix transcriptional regulator [Candidatus Minthosoma caballi]